LHSEQLFRAIFFVLITLMLAIRAYFGWQARRTGQSSWAVESKAVDREGRWSVLTRGFLFFYMVVTIALYAAAPFWLDSFAVSLPAWSRWAGAALGAASLPFLVWVHYILGQHWSTNLRLREEHRLVTIGPYRWVRHPMYTVLFSFFIGLTLVSASWLVVVLTVASISVLCRRIGIEEQMMLEQFGEKYREYLARTGRLLPRMRRQPMDDSRGGG
jgi:protein-S-isoprenylcysteine O-methyltransferase Ste14